MLLLEAAQKGDKPALGQLLQSFRTYLYLVADRILDADLKAKCSSSDLVQKTFLDAQKDLDQFEGKSAEEFRGWLERMLMNNLADLVRQYRHTEKRQVQREIPLSESWAEIQQLVDLSTPSKNAVAREERDRLLEALERLPEDYRRVLQLRSMEKRKFEDIARAMGRSTDAVKKLWARAVVRLKKEMKKQEE